MPSENQGAGFGGYKLSGLDPGSVVKANLHDEGQLRVEIEGQE
jgi:hypothetical protein